MYLSAFFTNLGVPETGLTPTITVSDLSDDSIAVNGQAMTEVANGWYKYNFTTHDQTKEYVVTCDGGAGLPVTERYVIFSIDAAADVPTVGEIADAVCDEVLSAHTVEGSLAQLLDLIRKIETNKWSLASSVQTIYDDDGSTALIQFRITDKNGNAIIQDAMSPATRTPV